VNLPKIVPVVLVLGEIFAFGQADQLVLDSDEYHYTATFDPKLISKERLRELLIFGPYDLYTNWKIHGAERDVSSEQSPNQLKKSLTPFTLEVCIDGNPIYDICGSRDLSDPNFFHNAEVNLRRNAESLAALDELNVPPELNSIARQFRDSLDFFNAVEQRRLEYLRTGDVGVLSMPIGSINPSTQCEEGLNNLRAAKTPQQRHHLSIFGWYNCVNDAWQQSSPVYPEDAWQLFLKDFGIREEFKPEAVD